MPGIHKNKTVAFRPSKCERIMIEEKALLSGLTKKDFITRSCINSKICVVGSMENIRYILDAIREMRYSLIEIGERLSSEKLAAGDICLMFLQSRAYPCCLRCLKVILQLK